MFSHIIIFGSSLPELLGGHSLCAIICDRVLITSQPDQARQYEITRIPTFLVIEDAKEIERLAGLQSEERLRELLRQPVAD